MNLTEIIKNRVNEGLYTKEEVMNMLLNLRD